MGKTVKQLLRELDSDELAEWMAYEVLEPWGEKRADRRAALITATYVNCRLKKCAKQFSVKDFMPRFGPVVKQSVAEMKTLLMGMVKATQKKTTDK